MNKITVSINPSYFCNFRCNFCYLTSKQLGDQKQIPLPILDKKLKWMDLLDINESDWNDKWNSFFIKKLKLKNK